MIYLAGLVYKESSQIRFPIRHEVLLMDLIHSRENMSGKEALNYLTNIPYKISDLAKQHISCLLFEADSTENLPEFFNVYFKNEQTGENSFDFLLMELNKENKFLGQWSKKNLKRKPSSIEINSTLEKIQGFKEYLFVGDESLYGASLFVAGFYYQQMNAYISWLPGMNNLKLGIYEIRELKNFLFLDEIGTVDNVSASDDEKIYVNNAIIPLLIQNKKRLLVEAVKDYPSYQWELASFNAVKFLI